MDNTIYIHGRLDENLLARIQFQIEALRPLSELPIILSIDSGGGIGRRTHEVVALLKEIRTKQPMRAIIAKIIDAGSAAVMFAAVASERYMLPKSKLTLHLAERRIGYADFNHATRELRSEVAADMDAQADNYTSTLGQWMPIPDPFFTRLMARCELTLDAETCIRLGLAKLVCTFD